MRAQHRFCIVILGGLVGVSATAFAETVIISSTNPQGQTTPYPPYRELNVAWSYSGLKSTLSAGGGSRTRTTGQSASFELAPTFSEAGGTYAFDLTHTTNAGVSPDVVMNIAVTGGTLVDDSNNPITSTTAFRLPGGNTWERVGILKLAPGVTQPSIVFTNSGGYASRIHADTFRFTSQQTCTSGLPILPPVKGPLTAGQTSVMVQGVDPAATKISVYSVKDGLASFKGERAAPIEPGDNLVPVTELQFGEEIIATQWNSTDIESCDSPVGSVVGWGPNTGLSVVLSIRETPFATGPIGSDGSELEGDLFFLGSSGSRHGLRTAPTEGQLVVPAGCWQTVAFQRGETGIYNYSRLDNLGLDGDFGVLDGIVLTPAEPTNTGSYSIFIDNVMNGGTLIQGFEGVSGSVLFAPPGTSDLTRPFLMPASGTVWPDLADVTASHFDSGQSSLGVTWQFHHPSADNWLILQTEGSGTPNPVVDLRLPISFRVLVLPIGASGAEGGPIITDQPDSATVPSGGSATFTVAATGSGTLQYQWLVNGEPAGANSPTLTLNDLHRIDHGARISVSVCDATGSTHSDDALLTVPCSVPFADADRDGDVDQDDFAIVQLCLDGSGESLLQGDCLCFDRDPAGPDGDVDIDDVAEFVKCASGPAIPWTPAALPDCVP